MKPLSRLDKLIIQHLILGVRRTIPDIAKQENYSVRNVAERVAMLKRSELIHPITKSILVADGAFSGLSKLQAKEVLGKGELETLTMLSQSEFLEEIFCDPQQLLRSGLIMKPYNKSERYYITLHGLRVIGKLVQRGETVK